MSVNAAVLRELHELHQRVSELQAALERGPRQIKTKRATVQNLQQELEAAQERKKQARMALDKKQQLLQSAEVKIADYQTKLNTCNNNREYQLLLEQIAADEMAKSVMEDEILEGYEKLETLTAAIATAERNLAQGKQELEKITLKVADEVSGLEERLAAVRGELQGVEQALPADFRPEYDRLIRHHGYEAMAAVEENVCTGCNQTVTPNMQSELAMQRVVICRGCARMLYLA